jgi:hypothetical protein
MKKVFLLCPSSQQKHFKNTVLHSYPHLKVCKIFNYLYKPLLFIIFHMRFNAVRFNIF